MNLKFSLRTFPNRGTEKQESKHHQLCVSEFFWKNFSKSGRNLAGQACTKLLLGHAHHSPAGRERLILVPVHEGPKLSKREQQGDCDVRNPQGGSDASHPLISGRRCAQRRPPPTATPGMKEEPPPGQRELL